VTPEIIGKIVNLKINQKMPEKHTRKAKNQGTTENSHIGNFTHTSVSTDVQYV
jgi:hypothetical protein